MTSGHRGIYRKFDIHRTDGSSESGGKHENCRYFVLDLTHDPFAIPALDAYAKACRETHPVLANDLDTIVKSEGSLIPSAKITEHEMLVTLANMALKMNDLTAADVLDAFRQLGYQSVVEEARELK